MRRPETLASKTVSERRSFRARFTYAHVSAERLGLKWVQTYITEFGGDPSKVTM